MHKPPKGNRICRLHVALTEAEQVELDRLAAEESARVGKIVTVSEYVRLRTFERVAA